MGHATEVSLHTAPCASLKPSKTSRPACPRLSSLWHSLFLLEQLAYFRSTVQLSVEEMGNYILTEPDQNRSMRAQVRYLSCLRPSPTIAGFLQQAEETLAVTGKS